MAIEYRLSYTASDINKKLGKVDTLSVEMAKKQDKLTFDSTPTSGSNNPVTSGGIYAALNTKQPVGDYALSSSIPKVPSWALRSEKPTYTAEEVGAATEGYVDAKISEMVDSAPETLDTLNKLSAALGDDDNFAATISQQIGNKVDKVDGMGLSSNNFTDEEKEKLASITSGANNYVLPVATSSAIGGVKSGTDITVDSNGNVSINDDSHNHVVSNIDGLQDALDTKQPVGDYALSSDIPFVYAWAKAENPPIYTASDVGALPDTTVIPTIPTNVSSFTNDVGYLTEHQDLSSYALKSEVPSIEGLATEEFVRDGYQPKGNYLTEVPEGYATEEFVQNKIAEAELGGEEVDLSGYAQKSELPTKVSQLENDKGYLTSYTETDPTVPDWAKAETKPVYTAKEVGAAEIEHTHDNYALKTDILSLDTTLSIEGSVADAKAVGDALAGKQPVGDYAYKSDISSINSVPGCSTSNNGQFLQVVNGVPTWTTVPSAEGVSF